MTNHLWKPKTPPKTGLSALRLFLAAKYIFSAFHINRNEPEFVVLAADLPFLCFQPETQSPTNNTHLEGGGAKGTRQVDGRPDYLGNIINLLTRNHVIGYYSNY